MKDNKIIAEFMGMELGDDKTMYYDDAENLHPPTPINELKHHTSWDWLMPVANKIIKSRDEQNTDWDLNNLKYALQTTNIEYVYKAVVKFINEYNKTINLK
jgi:hypothetical protein